MGKPVNTFYMYDAIGVWKIKLKLMLIVLPMEESQLFLKENKLYRVISRYKDVNNDGVFDKR